jgi:RND family efflux transporter MFP subunit
MKTAFSRCLHCKAWAWTFLGLFAVAALVAWGPTIASPPSPAKPAPKEGTTPGTLAIEVPGLTQCIPSRKSTIAPVPLHPVVDVLVALGDRVKKGQPLVKLDDDEARADVRGKQAALDSARIALKEARRYLAAAEKAYFSGALPEQKYHEARVLALKTEMDERVALAALDSAKAELEHYEVTAMIDGVVNSLEVHRGMVSRPGTTVWGEILDLGEIDVRCALTPQQADQLAMGQTAEIRANGKGVLYGTGVVTFVSYSAEKGTGLVPVVVRLPNREWRLRCNVPVLVCFNALPVNARK